MSDDNKSLEKRVRETLQRYLHMAIPLGAQRHLPQGFGTTQGGSTNDDTVVHVPSQAMIVGRWNHKNAPVKLRLFNGVSHIDVDSEHVSEEVLARIDQLFAPLATAYDEMTAESKAQEEQRKQAHDAVVGAAVHYFLSHTAPPSVE